jgi:hypothetical protein
MRSLLYSLFLLAPAQLFAQDDCPLDQEARRAENLRLQARYPGSRFLESDFELVITRNGDELTVNQGGCTHWGVTVNLLTSRTDRYSTEEIFFSKIVELVSEFAQGSVDLDDLAQLIEDKGWMKFSDENSTYYLLGYPGLTAFEASQSHSDTQTRIGFSFYR